MHDEAADTDLRGDFLTLHPLKSQGNDGLEQIIPARNQRILPKRVPQRGFLAFRLVLL